MNRSPALKAVISALRAGNSTSRNGIVVSAATSPGSTHSATSNAMAT